MKFAAVVVTYNRKSLLKEVLKAFDNQSRLPDYVIVVDNASTDGSNEVLRQWEKINVGNNKIVISSKANLGGSGGFYLGTKRALETCADWVWVSDDDAIPNTDTFEKAEQHLKEAIDNKNIAAICSQVQVEGKTDISHRKNIETSYFRMYQTPVDISKYNNKFFECNSCSYVGMIIKTSVLKKVGLINKDFFIWQDDLDHSIRISKQGSIICYPDMIVDHQITKSDYNGITWKTYYGYRNDLNVLKSYYPKRLFFFKCLRMYQKAIMHFDLEHIKLINHAIKGSLFHEKGINTIYKPGWKRGKN